MNKMKCALFMGLLVAAIAGYGQTTPLYTGDLSKAYFQAVVAGKTVKVSGAMLAPGSEVTPETFGAKGDGVSDDTEPIKRAIEGGGQVSFAPGRVYRVSSNKILLRSGTTLQGNGATIYCAESDNGYILAADNVEDWHIKNLNIKGSGKGSGTNTGLIMFGGRRCGMENVTISQMNGYGLRMYSGTDLPYYPGDQPKFLNCNFNYNYYGVETYPLRPEYINFSNCNASNNFYGLSIGTGNVNWVGGNITYNEIGIFLGGALGQNNSHGMFTSVNVNHNTQQNLYAFQADYGHSFTGCHFYGETSGSIKIAQSKGMSFVNCIIDGLIDMPDNFGYHTFTACQMEPSTIVASAYPAMQDFQFCFTKGGGLWSGNTSHRLPYPAEFQVKRSSGGVNYSANMAAGGDGSVSLYCYDETNSQVKGSITIDRATGNTKLNHGLDAIGDIGTEGKFNTLGAYQVAKVMGGTVYRGIMEFGSLGELFLYLVNSDSNTLIGTLAIKQDGFLYYNNKKVVTEP